MTSRDDSDGLARREWAAVRVQGDLASVEGFMEGVALGLEGPGDINRPSVAEGLRQYAAKLHAVRLLLLAGGAEVHTDKPKEPAP